MPFVWIALAAVFCLLARYTRRVTLPQFKHRRLVAILLTLERLYVHLSMLREGHPLDGAKKELQNNWQRADALFKQWDVCHYFVALRYVRQCQLRETASLSSQLNSFCGASTLSSLGDLEEKDISAEHVNSLLVAFNRQMSGILDSLVGRERSSTND